MMAITPPYRPACPTALHSYSGVHALIPSGHHLVLPGHTRQQLRKQLTRISHQLRKAQYQADHDHLTGLPNRRLLFDRLQQAMLMAGRTQRQLVVLLMDVDHFKSVNDTLGHAAGDQLLQEIARRLGSCLRSSDTAARLGGDEFVVMLPEVAGPLPGWQVMEKIRQTLAQPYQLGHLQAEISISIGMARHDTPRQTPDDLLAVADADMYRNKPHAQAPHYRHD